MNCFNFFSLFLVILFLVKSYLSLNYYFLYVPLINLHIIIIIIIIIISFLHQF